LNDTVDVDTGKVDVVRVDRAYGNDFLSFNDGEFGGLCDENTKGLSGVAGKSVRSRVAIM
jgi:hypothetical protein